MSRPVTLHVGLPKTGTTSLQMNLFLRHPQIAYVGKPLTRFSVAQAQVFEALMGWSPRRWREEQGALRTHVDELLASRPGERVVLFVRTARAAVEASGGFWLSPTPELPSQGWDASLPRVASGSAPRTSEA